MPVSEGCRNLLDSSICYKVTKETRYEFLEDSEGRIFRGLYREKYGRALTLGAIWKKGAWEKIDVRPIGHDMTLTFDPAESQD